jgi:acyl-homoserine lactone acylase PvdQ
VARYLIRKSNNITFEQFQDFAYDTTLYWPMTEFPVYARHLKQLQQTNPELAKDVQPYFDHFDGWDYQCTIDSTQATLAVQWYEVLYGRGYPVETLKPEFKSDIPARFDALVTAAGQLKELYGDWKIPYGKIHRLQRHAPYGSSAEVPFDDRQPSLPLAGVRGPLGVAFTVYHSPPTELPHRKNQYAATGASYMACYEFGERTRGVSYLHYGQSHDPKSPHFFDQAELLSQQKFKPAWLHWDDVLAHTKKAYHPGEE